MVNSDTHQSGNDLGSRDPEFEALSRQLAEKELELATLESELLVFQRRYTKIVGVLFAKLDDLEKEIARELYRLHPDDEHQQRFQDAERTAQSSQDAVTEGMDQTEAVSTPSEELKSLFRNVAKTIHPDFATNEQERLYRTSLMARANEAYKRGDMEALKQILYEWEHRDDETLTQERQPYELEHRILQIMRRIKEIEARMQQLKESELYQLMLRVSQAEQRGIDLLSEMADDLRHQIQAAQVRLDSLKRLKESGGS